MTFQAFHSVPNGKRLQVTALSGIGEAGESLRVSGTLRVVRAPTRGESDPRVRDGRI